MHFIYFLSPAETVFKQNFIINLSRILLYLCIEDLFIRVEVLRPNQPNGSCRARSVYLTTLLRGRLSQKQTTVRLQSEEGRE